MNRPRPHYGDLIKHKDTGKLALIIDVCEFENVSSLDAPVIMICWFDIKEFVYASFKNFELIAPACP